jgi:hypothetical protein
LTEMRHSPGCEHRAVPVDNRLVSGPITRVAGRRVNLGGFGTRAPVRPSSGVGRVQGHPGLEWVGVQQRRRQADN